MEGVNLSSFVLDTDDLSTVRGASLLLLDSVRWIKQEIKTPTLKPVTTGASSGIFEFEVLDQNGDEKQKVAEAVRDVVQMRLRDDPKFKHATFVVDVVGATENFVTDREWLIALNRFRQMNSPTVAVPVQMPTLAKLSVSLTEGVQAQRRFSCQRSPHLG